MKVSHLFRLAVASLLGATATLQAATFVQFDASNNQWSGGYQTVPSDFNNSSTRRWDFDMVNPLFGSTPPIYGGVNLVNTGTFEGGSSLGFNDNTPVTWPNVPEVYLYSVASGTTTLNNINMCYMWKRADFPGNQPSAAAVFNSISALSVRITTFWGGSPGNPEQIRFIVKNGNSYYVSEAAKTSGTGTLSLTDFCNNVASGKRWAPITLSGASFDIPATLTFTSQAFNDVQAVGWIGRGSRAYAGLFAFDSFSATGDYSSPGMSISQNLNGLASFSTAHPFIDVAKWLPLNWSTHNSDGTGAYDSGYHAQVPNDSAGWPTTVPFVVTGTSTTQTVFTAACVVTPGSYRLRFSGTGAFKIQLTGSTSWAKTFTPADCIGLPTDSDGKYYFDTPALVLALFGGPFPFGTITLTITNSSGAYYLRDFEFITPGYAASDYKINHPFNPAYLATMTGYRTLRMMDMGNTNNSTIVNWSDRTLPSMRSQTTANGAAIEYMIKFCNEAGKNLWFNVPSQASQTYVRNAAKVIHYGSRADGTPCTSATDPLRVWPGLNPGLKVYIEYSNETWNTAFHQYGYLLTSATTLRAQGLPFDPNDNTAVQQYTAYQSANIWDWFYQEYGASAKATLIRELGSMMSPGVCTQRLSAWLIPNLIMVNQYPDALAVAPYIGGSVGNNLVSSGSLAGITSAQIIQLVRDDMVNNVTPNLASIKTIADQYGVWLNCYEGGQHLVGTYANVGNPTLTAALTAANRDPGMQPLYADYLTMLKTAGVLEFTNFDDIGQFGNFGSWAVMEYLGQPVSTAYKYLPLQAWMLANPNPMQPPHPVITGSSAVLDSDGNGSQAVTLSGSNSSDYDGAITSYSWLVSGTQYSTAQITPTLPVGMNNISMTVTDANGLSSTGTCSVQVRPQGSDTVVAQSNFTGTSPGINKPWTSGTFATGLTMGGWTWVRSGTAAYVHVGDAANNAFAVQLIATSGTATFAMALTGTQCFICTVTPTAGKSLDLRGGYLEYTLNTVDGNSAKQCALMTNVGGFTAGSELYQYGPLPVPKATTIGSYLPSTAAYSNITGPFEMRIYLWGNQYAFKPIQLTSFKLTGILH